MKRQQQVTNCGKYAATVQLPHAGATPLPCSQGNSAMGLPLPGLAAQPGRYGGVFQQQPAL